MRVVGEVVPGKLIERAVEPAVCHHLRRLLFERSGRGIARIAKGRFAVGLAFGIQTVERGVGHKHLAAYLEEVGIVVTRERKGYAAYRAHILRNVVAAGAVPARHGAQQGAMLVGERYGRAVELELADKLRLADLLLHAVDPLVQLFERVGVAERQHGKGVLDTAELVRDVAAYACRRGVGVGHLGVCRLEVLKFTQKGVELVV